MNRVGPWSDEHVSTGGTSREQRTGGTASAIVDGVTAGIGLALLVSGTLLLLLALRNPFLVDSLPIALLVFLLLPGIAGAAVGFVGGASRGLVRPRRRPSGGPLNWQRRLLAVGLALVVVASLLGRLASVRVERGPAEAPVRLMLVGIDGATWDVAGPMMERGQLPTLASLVRGGASGVLESIEPTYSPRVFTTIATGKSADKHGIQTYADITSDAVVAKRLWNILADSLGWEYGVVEWYVTWPPAASPAGFAVPGLLAQNYDTIPPELSFIKKLRDQDKRSEVRGAGLYFGILTEGATNGLRLSTLSRLFGLALARATGAPLQVRHRAQQQAIVRVVSDATCYELARRPVQMLALVFKSTDSVSHRYWQYREPAAFSQVDQADVEQFGGTIEETYAVVDSELARLRRFVSPDGIIAIVSDHGFQARQRLIRGNYSLHAGTLLERMGFGPSVVSHMYVGGKTAVQPLTSDDRESARIRREVASAFRSARVEGYTAPPFEVVDVDREGTGDDYVEIVVTDVLTEGSEQGASLVTSDGTSIAIEDFLRPETVLGVHALDGVIVLAGEPFRQGATTTGASVLDVTPTLLAAVGLPVAEDMDGRVRVEAMSQEFLSLAPIRTVLTYETGAPVRRSVPAGGTIPEDVAERLRALGYID
jgi:predicted AlkP superfamily phosphohydrolase/phosphomutase